MNVQDVVTVVGPVSALLAPLLVYLAARGKLTQDATKNRAETDESIWQRMATMVDRYGKRADALDVKIEEMQKRLSAAEARASALAQEVSELKTMVKRWRSYAMALAARMTEAGLAPLDLATWGLELEEDG